MNFTFLLFPHSFYPHPTAMDFLSSVFLIIRTQERIIRLLCLTQKKDFPDEQFFVVFVIKPEDYACGGSFFIQGKR